MKIDCDLCLGTGMLEFGDEPPIESSCPRCKPWVDSVSEPDDCIDSGGFTPWGSPIMVPVPCCAQCRDLMREHESGAVCNRCDRENIQRDEDPDFTLDDLEWSEEHQ